MALRSQSVLAEGSPEHLSAVQSIYMCTHVCVQQEAGTPHGCGRHLLHQRHCGQTCDMSNDCTWYDAKDRKFSAHTQRYSELQTEKHGAHGKAVQQVLHGIKGCIPDCLHWEGGQYRGQQLCSPPHMCCQCEAAVPEAGHHHCCCCLPCRHL
jgi:hypothetical protein